MENFWARILSQNPPVKVKIKLKFKDLDNNKRPTKFQVTETLDGVEQEMVAFDNF